MAPNRARRIFVPTNPDLADILGRTDLDFENFYFFHFLDPKFLDFQVPRSPNFWISRPPGLQIPRFPDSRFPDFQTLLPPDELSDPNLTPLPTRPGIKYVASMAVCHQTVDIHWWGLTEILLGFLGPYIGLHHRQKCPW